jgi:hypothetical protein
MEYEVMLQWLDEPINIIFLVKKKSLQSFGYEQGFLFVERVNVPGSIFPVLKRPITRFF